MTGIWRRKGMKKWLALIAMVAVVGVVIWYVLPGKPDPVNGAELITVPATRSNLSKSVTGSGSVTAAERKEVNSESTGTVAAIYVNEGQFVNKGDLLMTLNSASNDLSIRQSELSLQLSQKSLQDLYDDKNELYIYAPASGQINGTMPNVDQSVKEGSTFATILDQGKMQATAEFILSEGQSIAVGDTIEFFIQDYLETLYGTVTGVSSTAISNSNGRRYQVTASVINPGLLTTSSEFTITLANSYGRIAPTSNSSLTNADPTVVEYKTDGKVAAVYVKDQEWVEKGQLLAMLTSSSLDDNINTQAIKLEQSRLDLEKLYDDLNSRTIYAPISGTVISLGVTEGEEVTEKSSSLVTISYLEAMTVVVAVDELDIPSVKAGMEAIVTCDALPNTVFNAYVSEIALEGSTSSGVATFDVTLQIDQPGDLRSGMTVNAEIVISNRANALVIPLAALAQEGPNYYVALANADGSAGERRQVRVGEVNSAMVEITEGLEEGQQIVYQPYSGTDSTAATTNDTGFGGGGEVRIMTSPGGAPPSNGGGQMGGPR